MKIRVAMLAMAIAAPLGAESQTTATLDVWPEEATQWTSGPVSGLCASLKLRLHVPEGEWMLPAVDAHLVTPPSNMPWLTASAYGPINNPSLFGLHSALGEDVALKGNVFEYQAKLGYTDGEGSTSTVAVRSYYVPCWSGVTQYVWKSNSAMWTTFYSNGYYGATSEEAWQSLNYVDSQGTIDAEVFSVESLFRKAILIRTWQAGQPNGTANAFFETEAYQSAVTAPAGDEAYLTIQGIALVAPQYLGAATSVTPQNPAAMPVVTLPPVARLTNAVQISLTLPNPDETTVHAKSLLGTFYPGGWHYFTLTNTVPPVRLFFPTQGGLVPLTATGAATIKEPCRYKIWVPDDVVQGDIYVSDYRDYMPFKIGSVDSVASQ